MRARFLQKKKNLRLIRRLPPPPKRQAGNGYSLGRRRRARAGQGCGRDLEDFETKVVTKRPPTKQEMARHALWLARGEAREIERDCLRGSRSHARHRRRPDVAGRCVAHRGLESGRSRAFAQGQRGGERCLLSVSRMD